MAAAGSSRRARGAIPPGVWVDRRDGGVGETVARATVEDEARLHTPTASEEAIPDFSGDGEFWEPLEGGGRVEEPVRVNVRE